MSLILLNTTHHYSLTVPGRLAVARPIFPLLCVARFPYPCYPPRWSALRVSQFLCPLFIRTYCIGLAAIFCVPPNRSSFIASPHLSRTAYPMRSAETWNCRCSAATSSPLRIWWYACDSLAMFCFGCFCRTMGLLLLILQLSSLTHVSLLLARADFL